MTKIVKKYSEPGEWEVEIPFEEVGSEKEWIGIIDARKAGEYKLKVTANHKVLGTKGRITVRAVVGERAHVDIKGVVKIGKEAQRTDSFLELRALMLDKTARAIADPELEIEANNVKASHAASVGQLDPEQMLYLTSRGLNKEQARDQIAKGWLEV